MAVARLLFRFETALKGAVTILEADGVELNHADSWGLVQAAIRSEIKKVGAGKGNINLTD